MRIYLLSFLLIFSFVFSKKISFKQGLTNSLKEEKPTPHPFEVYTQNFNKIYEPEEYETRKEIYMKNRKKIKAHNLYFLNTWKAGENQFTDWTDEEFNAYLTKFPTPESEFTPLDRSKLQPLTDIPTSFDCSGNMTSAKNQGSCGASWAFSAIGITEGAFAIHEDILIDLSQQDAISCDGSDSGCYSGTTYGGLGYLSVSGACADHLWPYEESNGTCGGTQKTDCESQKYVYLNQINSTDLTSLPENERVDVLMQIVSTYGPVGGFIDASLLDTYSWGLWNIPWCSSNTSDANQFVTIVGYGIEGTTPFWKIKNSWGTDWGEAGYFRFVKGLNVCGIENYAFFAESVMNFGLTKFNGAVTGLKVVSNSSKSFEISWDPYPGADKYFVKASLYNGEYLYVWETSNTSFSKSIKFRYITATCWVGPIKDSQYGNLGVSITFDSAHTISLSFFALLLILFNFF
ncbi:cathepsin l1 [Anaeramoeba ignava]|uniref:Cathepsin l1 n=1 Tax=Anaeramoeba ignava TaxID=1746090 RepID=A0A9Q0LBL6_ANAIG|nr:cathepsin l1 [Anaeramoeba ignava]